MQNATILYGDLAAYAAPLANLPAVLLGPLAISLVPAISEAAAIGNRFIVGFRIRAAMRVTFIIALPAMVGLYVLGSQIPAMLWRRPEAEVALSILASVTLFLPLQQVSSGALQGLGLPPYPCKTSSLGR